MVIVFNLYSYKACFLGPQRLCVICVVYVQIQYHICVQMCEARIHVWAWAYRLWYICRCTYTTQSSVCADVWVPCARVLRPEDLEGLPLSLFYLISLRQNLSLNLDLSIFQVRLAGQGAPATLSPTYHSTGVPGMHRLIRHVWPYPVCLFVSVYLFVCFGMSIGLELGSSCLHNKSSYPFTISPAQKWLFLEYKTVVCN